MNILIVDDIAKNIQVTMNILREESYIFSFASDGFEVCRRLKLIDEYKDILIIFLSARTDIDSMTKGFKLGGVDYIVKPFHAEELLSRVRTHLELTQAKKLLK